MNCNVKLERRHDLIPIFSVSSLKDVQRRTENVNTDEDPSGWRPYFTFVDNLREKFAKNEGFQGMTIHYNALGFKV